MEGLAGIEEEGGCVGGDDGMPPLEEATEQQSVTPRAAQEQEKVCTAIGHFQS